MTIWDGLIWGGTALTLAGLVALAWCIVSVARAKARSLDDTAMRAVMRRVVVVNMAALAAYGSRLVTWHLRQSRDNVWLEELADGDIDYRWIARQADERRLPRLFEVEIALAPNTHLTRDAIANHRRSRDYVRSVFGV